MKTLSPTQAAVLKAAVSVQDAAVAASLARWGAEDSQARAARGTHCQEIEHQSGLAVIRYPTMHALEALGLVTLEHFLREHHSLCRGAYGRWIGGTTKHSYVETFVRPTDAGRAYLAAERK